MVEGGGRLDLTCKRDYSVQEARSSAAFFSVFFWDGNGTYGSWMGGGSFPGPPRLRVKLQFHSEFSSGKWSVSGWKTILSYWVSVSFQGFLLLVLRRESMILGWGGFFPLGW